MSPCRLMIKNADKRSWAEVNHQLNLWFCLDTLNIRVRRINQLKQLENVVKELLYGPTCAS